jgi:signal transduction histidine kinase
VGQEKGRVLGSFVPQTISAKLATGRTYIVTTVSDHGPGVPPEDREAIFNKFFTTKRRGETRRKGVGLGLAFCKLAVEAHHGEIWVAPLDENDGYCLRQGCRFCFVLPAMDSKSE